MTGGPRKDRWKAAAAHTVRRRKKRVLQTRASRANAPHGRSANETQKHTRRIPDREQAGLTPGAQVVQHPKTS